MPGVVVTCFVTVLQGHLLLPDEASSVPERAVAAADRLFVTGASLGEIM